MHAHLRRTGEHAPIIGIDQSLTGTGVCVLTSNRVETRLLEPSKGLHPVHRLRWFRAEFRALLDPGNGADPRTLVVFEGYGYGAKNSHSHALGELGGVLKLALLDAGLEAAVVPPSVLKKFVTGKGNAPKDQVAKELFKRFGVDTLNNNEADAAGLAIIGLGLRGALANGALPKAHLAALKEAERIPTLRQAGIAGQVVVSAPARPRPRAA